MVDNKTIHVLYCVHTRGREYEMKLGELLNVMDPLHDIKIFMVGEDGFCYEGRKEDVTKELLNVKVVSFHAFEDVISVLVRK